MEAEVEVLGRDLESQKALHSHLKEVWCLYAGAHVGSTTENEYIPFYTLLAS
jgi:hypothetical protein